MGASKLKTVTAMDKEENKKEERPIAWSVPAAVVSQEDANGVAKSGVAPVPDGPSKTEHDFDEGMVSGASVAAPGVEHREGEGVSTKITPEDNIGQINKTHNKSNEPWWLSGETEVNGVKKLLTLDDVLNSDPSLESTLKGGDFLYNILNYRKEHNMPALDPGIYRTMLGKHSMDKTAKQEKRDRVRHFLADAIQPVADVLKAAAAYGYGKAGRTFIPAGKSQEPGFGERMRRLEEVRAAQNWDAWADTFRMSERERLQQKAEARRAAAREQERQQRIVDDFNGHVRKREYDAAHRYKTPDEEAYEEFRSQGMSPSEAVARRYGLTHGGNRVGGSGGGRGAGGGRQGKTQYFKVGKIRYNLGQAESAIKHAHQLKNPNISQIELNKWYARLSPNERTAILESILEN